MKINWFLAAVVACLAALCAFGFFRAHVESQYRLVITIGSFISLFVPLTGMIAVKLDFTGAINVRIVSALAFIALLVDHIIFTVRIKAWQLQLLKLAFGEAEIDTSKIESLLKTVPSEVFKDVGSFSLTSYIIITGILLLGYVLIAYGIAKAMKDAR